jgi:hypothetical protein
MHATTELTWALSVKRCPWLVVSADEEQRRGKCDVTSEYGWELTNPTSMSSSSRYAGRVFRVAVCFCIANAQRKIKPAKDFSCMLHSLSRLGERAVDVSKGNESDSVHEQHRATVGCGLQASGLRQ